MRIAFFLLLVCGVSAAMAQQTNLPGSLVAEGAAIEKAGTGYSFTEGSSVAPDGSVFFTDQPNDKIYKWNETTGVILFKEGTGRSNGTTFDKKGNLITCADEHNTLEKFGPDGKMQTVYSGGYEGKYFNGPNDLWINKNGGIYFTDPYYQRNYWEKGHKMAQDVQAVYYLKPSGQVIRVIDDLRQPNGIAGTADGKILYVADIAAGQTYSYVIAKDGTLTGKKLFAAAGSDGMTIDEQGNVYLTYGTVQIFNSKGEKAGEITLPESPSNLCFGGKNRDILFITARTSVYIIKMKVKGIE